MAPRTFSKLSEETRGRNIFFLHNERVIAPFKLMQDSPLQDAAIGKKNPRFSSRRWIRRRPRSRRSFRR